MPVEQSIESDFDALIKQAMNYARGTIARILRRTNLEAVDDVLQNAAVQAWRFKDKFEGRSAFNTWFTTIAKNEALMYLRKYKILDKRELSLEDQLSAEAFEPNKKIDALIRDQRLNPEQRLLAIERTDELKRLILNLLPNCRFEILATYSGEYGFDERVNNRSVSARKSLRRRARQSLCVSLGKEYSPKHGRKIQGL